MKNKHIKFLTLIFLLFTATFVVACGHSHSYETETISPTQTDMGYTHHFCSCGEYFDDDFTCLLTFNSTSIDTSIPLTDLPQIAPKVVAQNSIFEAIANTQDFKVSTYTGATVGQKVTNSMTITIVWDKFSQAEKDCISIADKINDLCSISYKYNSSKYFLRASQYLRTAKYTGNTWNIMAGTIESDFVDYVSQNQGSKNISSLRTISEMVSPVSNEKLDFIHMFAVINSIENFKNNNQSSTISQVLNSNASDLSGWIGDICTLVQEIVNASVVGDEIQVLANQKFNNASSTFSGEDLIADMDAVNIMKIYYSSSLKTFANVFEDYYFSTTSQQRKNLFINNVFKKTYTSANTLADDIILRLKNNFLAQYFCSTLGISFTEHEAQFNAVAIAFANYFV